MATLCPSYLMHVHMHGRGGRWRGRLLRHDLLSLRGRVVPSTRSRAREGWLAVK